MAQAFEEMGESGLSAIGAADLEHGEDEARWSSVGIARNGEALSVVYVWSEADAVFKNRQKDYE